MAKAAVVKPKITKEKTGIAKDIPLKFGATIKKKAVPGITKTDVTPKGAKGSMKKEEKPKGKK